MFNTGYGGLIGLLILIGDVWAIINIFQSSASNEKKLLWTVVVILLPLLGLILWYFLGPRGGRTQRATLPLGAKLPAGIADIDSGYCRLTQYKSKVPARNGRI